MHKFRSALFVLFILAGCGFIGYGVYTFIQDQQTDLTEAEEVKQTSENALSNTAEQEKKLEENENTETNKDDTSDLSLLNGQTESDTKNKLALEYAINIDEETTAPPSVDANLLSIVFSTYDEKTKQLSLGVTFYNTAHPTNAACFLEIQDSANVSVTKKVAVATHPSLNGCRFNQIDLSSLESLSANNYWRLNIEVKDQGTSQTLAVPFTRTLTSIGDLNKLNS